MPFHIFPLKCRLCFILEWCCRIIGLNDQEIMMVASIMDLWTFICCVCVCVWEWRCLAYIPWNIRKRSEVNSNSGLIEITQRQKHLLVLNWIELNTCTMLMYVCVAHLNAHTWTETTSEAMPMVIYAKSSCSICLPLWWMCPYFWHSSFHLSLSRDILLWSTFDRMGKLEHIFHI